MCRGGYGPRMGCYEEIYNTCILVETICSGAKMCLSFFCTFYSRHVHIKDAIKMQTQDTHALVLQESEEKC